MTESSAQAGGELLLRKSVLAILALLVAAGCPAVEEEERDAGVEQRDAGFAENDGGVDESDAGVDEPDGFGVISGPCGFLDDELTSTEPSTFVNHIDFGTDPYDDADAPLLTEGGREIIADGNAGGSSLLSEVFAYEVLARCEGALLFKTETEVDYTVADSAITDLVVDIDDVRIGVSVTRAVGFPFDAPYTEQQAFDLLDRKLGDIVESSANVAPADAWRKQILHVIAYAEGHVASIEAALANVDPAKRVDTIVIVTVSDGDDAFLY